MPVSNHIKFFKGGGSTKRVLLSNSQVNGSEHLLQPPSALPVPLGSSSVGEQLQLPRYGVQFEQQ